MRRQLFAKLASAWLLFLLVVPGAIVWIGPDYGGSHPVQSVVKLAIICAACGALSAVWFSMLVREWWTYLTRVEQFIAALPAQESGLPLHGPPEFERLARTIAGMAGRVQKLVEQANLEVARRETILACMAEGVLAVDNNLKVVFCNNAFARTFGTRIPNSEGRALFEVVREPILRDILHRVLSTGATETDRLQLPSAAGKWFEARALAFGPSNRRSAVIVLHDTTDIQRQEQLRKDFVADVSHELRTPLAAIRGYAETLLDGGLEDTTNNRKFVEIIQAHAVRLNNIASDLLVLASLDSETNIAEPQEPVEVLGVIESAIDTVSGAAQDRGITIDIAGCQPCTVLGIRYRLEQVMVNLLDNAVKFNRDGGKVSVECALVPEAKAVRLSVSDTGTGIPSGDLGRIFERFYRVDKARSRTAGGTGLGLPIVKEAVTRMRGTIAVESQLGRGSKFTITLKAA